MTASRDWITFLFGSRVYKCFPLSLPEENRKVREQEPTSTTTKANWIN